MPAQGTGIESCWCGALPSPGESKGQGCPVFECGCLPLTSVLAGWSCRPGPMPAGAAALAPGMHHVGAATREPQPGLALSACHFMLCKGRRAMRNRRALRGCLLTGPRPTCRFASCFWITVRAAQPVAEQGLWTRTECTGSCVLSVFFKGVVRQAVGGRHVAACSRKAHVIHLLQGMMLQR